MSCHNWSIGVLPDSSYLFVEGDILPKEYMHFFLEYPLAGVLLPRLSQICYPIPIHRFVRFRNPNDSLDTSTAFGALSTGTVTFLDILTVLSEERLNYLAFPFVSPISRVVLVYGAASIEGFSASHLFAFFLSPFQNSVWLLLLALTPIFLIVLQRCAVSEYIAVFIRIALVIPLFLYAQNLTAAAIKAPKPAPPFTTVDEFAEGLERGKFKLVMNTFEDYRIESLQASTYPAHQRIMRTLFAMKSSYRTVIWEDTADVLDTVPGTVGLFPESSTRFLWPSLKAKPGVVDAQLATLLAGVAVGTPFKELDIGLKGSRLVDEIAMDWGAIQALSWQRERMNGFDKNKGEVHERVTVDDHQFLGIQDLRSYATIFGVANVVGIIIVLLENAVLASMSSATVC